MPETESTQRIAEADALRWTTPGLNGEKAGAQVEREADALLVEMEDWGRALLAEHERRICDVHGPVVPSKNTGESIVQYAERLREAIDRDDIDKSLHGETPWDEDARSVSDLARKYEGRAANASARYCRSEDVAADLRALLASRIFRSTSTTTEAQR